jgi:FHA domain-containing protein/uncharacterized protein DUF1707
VLLPLRASDRDRDRAVGVLKQGYVAGRLSTQTFEARVAVAQTTRSRAVLRELLADLSARWLATRTVLEGWGARREAPAPWATLLLSRRPDGVVIVGRSSSCDVVFGDEAVSRRHACFDRVGGRWHVTDLHSTNGTSVDGIQVERAPVDVGCQVRLGGDAVLDIA